MPFENSATNDTLAFALSSATKKSAFSGNDRKKKRPILIDRTKESKEERAARIAKAKANPGELEQPITGSRGNLDFSVIPGFVDAQTTLLSGGTKAEQVLFNKSLADAKDRLKGECLSKLGGEEAVNKVLRTGKFSVIMKDTGDPNDYSKLSRGTNSIGFVRDRSFLTKNTYHFFDNFSLDSFVKPNGQIELGAYTILESVGGLTGSIRGLGTAALGDFARIGNAETILKYCFGEIAPLTEEPSTFHHEAAHYNLHESTHSP